MPGTTSSIEMNIKTLVRAGAGAGKTTELIDRFINYVRRYFEVNQTYPNIIITTFTRKATQEVKERLLIKALDLKDETLFHYINRKSQVHISTIHGILSLFLSRYGESLGLAPEFSMVDAQKENYIARKILRQVFKDNPDKLDFLEDYRFDRTLDILLTLTQYRLMNSSLRAFSLEDLFQHRQRLLNQVLEQIQKCSVELRTAQSDAWVLYGDSLRSYFRAEMQFPEFQKACQLFLQAVPAKPRFNSNKPPVSEETRDLVQIVNDTLKEWAKEEKSDYTDSFLQLVASRSRQIEEIFDKFFGTFVQYKIAHSELTMSDLESFSLELIRRDPSVAQKFAQSWNFWMLDEYQDTSPVQVELLKHLMGDSSYFVVGDPQQSIYLFRGARKEVFYQKEAEILKMKSEFLEKLVNFRSHPNLLRFFNHVFTQMGPQFKAMVPREYRSDEKPEDVCCRVLLTFEGVDEDEDIRLLSGISEIQRFLGLGIAPEKICVLSRSNGDLERLAELCKQLNLPIQVHGSGQFYRRREVQDLLVFLRFLSNPHDEKNFMTLLRQPYFECSDSELVQWAQAHYESSKKSNLKSSLFGFWRESYGELKLVQRLLGYREKLRHEGYLNTLLHFIEQEGVLTSLQYMDSTGRREANIFKLVTILRSQENLPGFSIFDFVQNHFFSVDTESGGEDSDATPVIEPKRVNLMTIHASKGLQFEAVVVLGCQQKPVTTLSSDFWIDEDLKKFVIPVLDDESGESRTSLLGKEIRLKLNDREKEEFERVLYVALTRAQRYLSLCAFLKSEAPPEESWLGKMRLQLAEGVHSEFHIPYETVHFVDLLNLETTLESAGKLEKIEALNLGLESISKKSVTSSLQSVAAPSLKIGQVIDVAKKAARGTEVHRLFEVLKYRPDYVDEIDDLAFKRALAFLNRQTIFPFQKIVNDGHVEWGFVVNDQGTYVQGQIDLWAEFEDAIWVVDYKTGSTAYQQKAFEQLSVYAKALKIIYPRSAKKPFRLVVVYPFEEIVVEKTL